MSNMKCPFCKEEIISDVCIMFDKKTKDYINGKQIYKCNKCGWYGNKELWQELIRTRKALDVAKDTIRHADWFFDGDYNIDAKTMHNEIKYAIKAITALEQKDKR